jgi:Fe-S cluster biogenesis protein NfuA
LDALEHVRSLVQPDGGDIEMVSIDPGTGVVNLRLLVEGASCKECIMPRSILEDIAADVMRKTLPDLGSVSIDDPREAPDYIDDTH